MPNALPFEIQTHLVDRRGMIQYVAVRDGKELGIAKYLPGDIDKRNKAAREWADKNALRNGKTLTITEVADALERAECCARADVAAATSGWISAIPRGRSYGSRPPAGRSCATHPSSSAAPEV